MPKIGSQAGTALALSLPGQRRALVHCEPYAMSALLRPPESGSCSQHLHFPLVQPLVMCAGRVHPDIGNVCCSVPLRNTLGPPWGLPTDHSAHPDLFPVSPPLKHHHSAQFPHAAVKKEQNTGWLGCVSARACKYGGIRNDEVGTQPWWMSSLCLWLLW